MLDVRVIPLRTQLQLTTFYYLPVGAVHDILPEDPEHPRFLRFTVEVDHGLITAVFEFDTVESARDWRRDFSGELLGG